MYFCVSLIDFSKNKRMNYFSSDFKLGILGGGQLGKMLLYDTRKFDIYTSVLDASNEAPCQIACNEFHLGNLMNYDDVYNFGKQVDVLTIEIENVNVDALEDLEKEGIKVYPASKTLRTIQNKAKQKLFYIDNDFISEKIWKPIFQYHPFIVIGRPNMLKYLKEIFLFVFYYA